MPANTTKLRTLGLKAPHVCYRCVGEPYLFAKIRRKGQRAICSFCSKTRRAISIEALADEIEGAIERHYERTPDAPEDGYELFLAKEGRWSRSGGPIADVIAEAAMVEPHIAEDVRKILEDRTYDFELAKMGEEGPFDEGVHYGFRDVSDFHFRAEWEEFERIIQTRSRFFSAAALATLNSIFAGIHSLQTQNGRPIVVSAGPSQPISSLFRARAFQGDGHLDEALKFPDRELGPPPSRAAIAGRMNPQGISVFYGAITAPVAVAEIRPPVGSKVAVAKFEILRPLKLLDVEALRAVLVSGSIFDDGYSRRLEHGKFLERLGTRISQPVLPHDEPFQYLVTQAIAEYLADAASPRLDGIIYASAQTNNSAQNVVLFHHAARVARIEISKGTTIFVNAGYDDEAQEHYYSVYEQLPKKDDQASKTLEKTGFSPFGDFLGSAASRDNREISLRVDLPEISVHHIRAVTYDAESYPVARRTLEEDDILF